MSRVERLFRLSEVKLAVIEGFNERAFQAYKALEGRIGSAVSRDEIARMVAEITGEDPVSPTSVGRWMKDAEPKNLRTVAALARVLGVPAGWLAFGEEDRAAGSAQPAKTRTEVLAEQAEAVSDYLAAQQEAAPKTTKRSA